MVDQDSQTGIYSIHEKLKDLFGETKEWEKQRVACFMIIMLCTSITFDMASWGQWFSNQC